MKKKLTALILIFGMALIAGFLPGIMENFLPEATTVQLRQVAFTDSVSASGEVQKKGAKEVSAEIPLVLGEVLAVRGQQISEGEAVATVNRAETARKLMQSGQYSALALAGAGTSITSYDDILALIPEEITASASGTVDSVNAGDGDYLSPGSPVVNLIGSEDLVVSALVSEKNISKVEVGQQALITGSGFGGKVYDGVVEEISPAAKKQYVGTAQDTVVETRIRFKNADENIRAGYTAKVKILTSEQKSLSVIPYEFINADETGKEFVYVFKSGLAVRRDIETGIELPDGVQVVEGISPEEYVLASEDSVTDGGYIKIKE